VRPKIAGADEPAADFLIHGPDKTGLPGGWALYGIESPGLTACLALGDEVARLAA
jgi:L-2-hydroxyglutarate oxidase LhgO